MADLVRYMIPPTTMDGPAGFGRGDEVEVRLMCDVVVEGVSDGMGGPTALLRTLKPADFAGPYRRSFRAPPAPVPPVVVAACAEVLEAELKVTPESEVTPESMARVVLEQVGRMLRADDEASGLIIGVQRLDIEKLTRAGDALAETLADEVGHDAVTPVRQWREVRARYGLPKPEADRG